MTDINRPVDILLVEDSDADQALVLMALEKSNIANTPFIAEDGEEALAILKGLSKRTQGMEGEQSYPRPDLIILDLNLPKKNGREVLSEIKSDSELKKIPVIILSSSQSKHDIDECYKLGANCYLSKGGELAEFFEAMKGIESFWLSLVKLPTNPAKGSLGHA